jgi:hypothetical protein
MRRVIPFAAQTAPRSRRLEGIKKLLRRFIPSSRIRKWILRTGKWIEAYRSEFANHFTRFMLHG